MSGLPELRKQLLGLVDEDDRVREELAADGSLFEGYHPRMREVHERNAAALEQILDQHGWPGIALAGEEGAAAAWRIAQHGISLPAFQRRCLKLLETAAARGDADAKHAACLDDRIAFNERRPQKYGTQFDWDERGEMSPWTLDDPREVEIRRIALGVKPLAEQIRDTRGAARWPLEHAPKDWHARQREIEEWARSVGWIE